MTATALELVDRAISDLEARLNLKPGEIPGGGGSGQGNNNNNNNKKKEKKQKQPQNKPKQQAKPTPPADQPDICKLEFKVGQITKVWNHPEADKLYCEEIDVGEESGPRQIASGLRPHFTLEEMQGQRLLVVSNLKAKNLVRFKSHGMVLCAAEPCGDGEKVEFIEPPEDAPIGEVITFEGLPTPVPISAAQVEKRKVFQACMPGMKTSEDGTATWNGHAFKTAAGPCKAKTIKGGVLR